MFLSEILISEPRQQQQPSFHRLFFMSVKDEIICNSLRIARDWDKKENPNWSSRNYSTALFGMLSKVVQSHDNKNAGIAALVEEGAFDCLFAFLDSTRRLNEQVSSGNLPISVFGGNYHFLTFAHIATLLGQDQEALELLELSNKKEIAQLGTKFWRFYASSLWSLLSGEKFSFCEIKLRKGLEQYLISYVELMSALSKSENVDCILKKIDSNFTSRNADKKIRDDQFEVEGSAIVPVRWDFRKDAILMIHEGRGK